MAIQGTHKKVNRSSELVLGSLSLQAPEAKMRKPLPLSRTTPCRSPLQSCSTPGGSFLDLVVRFFENDERAKKNCRN